MKNPDPTRTWFTIILRFLTRGRSPYDRIEHSKEFKKMKEKKKKE